MADETEREAPRLSLIGDRFPDLTVETTHGTKRLPEEYEGEWFVLFSIFEAEPPASGSDGLSTRSRKHERVGRRGSRYHYQPNNVTTAV